MSRWLFWSILFLSSLPSAATLAKSDEAIIQESHSCLKIIQNVARQYQVPVSLLTAIAQVESGLYHQRHPWPWTIHYKRQAYYFKTKEAAHNYLNRLYAIGIDRIDIGCMQINYRSHAQHFNHPTDLLCPKTCITYAAKLLKRHHQQTGSWQRAAALYHSRCPKFQKAYLQKINLVLQRDTHNSGY